MNLFGTEGAIFSDDRKYRYVLWRIWDEKRPFVAFIGLNPSVANELKDDPTIRRVKKFASDWQYGGVYMLNLFAYITPYPAELRSCEDPVGENDKYLEEYGRKCDKVIFAYGSFEEAIERAKKVKEMFTTPFALIINQDGSPRHPLYVPANTIPVIYSL
jgi:hypothetical protein